MLSRLCFRCILVNICIYLALRGQLWRTLRRVVVSRLVDVTLYELRTVSNYNIQSYCNDYILLYRQHGNHNYQFYLKINKFTSVHNA